MISISENNGLELISEEDLRIYSVGISTGGSAEVRMALKCPKRQIIATTIDEEGAKFARAYIDSKGVVSQITVKVEDVASTLPYSSGYFDFIYSRLALHYLSKAELKIALHELYRVVKPSGRIFVVVRYLPRPGVFNADTCMTTHLFAGALQSRYFHTKETIEENLASVGFTIICTKMYTERLCVDFERKKPSEYMDDLIEVLAKK